jgi:hypothetical protein
MNKQRINQLMDYLYEEMDPDERMSFEHAVQQDRELAAELGSLSSVRKTLSALSDVEPDKKPNIADLGKDRSATGHSGHRWIKPLLTVAASIALVFVAGYATQLQLQINSGGLYIGFSPPSTVGQGMDNSATPHHQDLVLETLQKETQQINKKLTALQGQIQLLNNASIDSSENPEKLVDRVEKSYRAGLEELYHYIDTHNLQQRAYFRDVITEYANYMQTQREEDLLAVGQALGKIQQNQTTQSTAAKNLYADIVPSTTFE